MMAVVAALAMATGLSAPFDPPAPPPSPAAAVLTLDSTSYCQAGIMADGQETYWGAAAGNEWPFGTRLRILTGRLAGTVVTIADRIGWGSQLDVFSPSCAWSWAYGREAILAEIVS